MFFEGLIPGGWMSEKQILNTFKRFFKAEKNNGSIRKLEPLAWMHKD